MKQNRNDTGIRSILITLIMMLMLGSAGCRNASAQIDSEPLSEFPSELIEVAAETEETMEEIELLPKFTYTYVSTHPFDGRQGIAWTRGEFYVSGNQSLYHYDYNWNLVQSCLSPFSDIEENVNHISDIDIYRDELFAGVERFHGGYAENFMIAIYDLKSFQLKRTYPIEKKSGLREISGITVDKDTSSIWVCSWVDERTGEFIYRYDLITGEYLGRYHMENPIAHIQGVSYFRGSLYFSADDGDAGSGKPDHLYRCPVDVSKAEFPVVMEREFSHVMVQGEMEGLDFDYKNNQLLICYNRGVLIPEGTIGLTNDERRRYTRNYRGAFIYDLNLYR